MIQDEIFEKLNRMKTRERRSFTEVLEYLYKHYTTSVKEIERLRIEVYDLTKENLRLLKEGN